MSDHGVPTGKISRVLTGGRTAAKIGGKVIGYYTKRPFLSKSGRMASREKASLESAQTLFQGVSLLKGTALKLAQMLSMELEMLPEEICRELSKSYHRVPPINRALVRKVVQDGLGHPPEALFSRFDPQAFAAASLGQVHRAANGDGRDLAVKIQYPGIAKTIRSDVGLMRSLLGPVIKDDLLLPTLNEVAARLREEVDYFHEADNLNFFSTNLAMEGVGIPRILPQLSSGTVLTTTMMPGKPLDEWLQDNPSQADKDFIARKLNALVLKGAYELNVIHADPNPGNFIIAPDLTIGLVDYGCVKRFDPDFVEQYRQLALAAAHQDEDLHFERVVKLGLLPPDLDHTTRMKVAKMSQSAGQWFGRLFAEEVFDFKANPGFIAEGQTVMRRFHHLYRHLRVNPDFIFLDRTRYGLLRIFEKMGARVEFRNPFEW
jgi:predicted unusual protein kinase regulating ubiquinone biosynthesis (AarF/ABC1/UbiB family)